MITIFKDKKDIPGDMGYVELNDLFFDQNTASLLDGQAIYEGTCLKGQFHAVGLGAII